MSPFLSLASVGAAVAVTAAAAVVATGVTGPTRAHPLGTVAAPASVSTPPISGSRRPPHTTPSTARPATGAARRPSRPAAPSTQRRAVSNAPWTWPLAPNPGVRRAYDAPVERWAPGHRGVDLVAARPVVRAASDGVVAFVGVVAGRPVVAVDHARGLRTTYEPVRPGVEVGAVVTAGQPIGTVIAQGSHCGATPCLHWGLRRGRDYLDPLTMLTGRQPILLPLR